MQQRLQLTLLNAWRIFSAHHQMAAFLYAYSALSLIKPYCSEAVTVVMQLTSTILLIQTPFSSAFRGAAILSKTTVCSEN